MKAPICNHIKSVSLMKITRPMPTVVMTNIKKHINLENSKRIRLTFEELLERDQRHIDLSNQRITRILRSLSSRYIVMIRGSWPFRGSPMITQWWWFHYWTVVLLRFVMFGKALARRLHALQSWAWLVFATYCYGNAQLLRQQVEVAHNQYLGLEFRAGNSGVSSTQLHPKSHLLCCTWVRESNFYLRLRYIKGIIFIIIIFDSIIESMHYKFK